MRFRRISLAIAVTATLSLASLGGAVRGATAAVPAASERQESFAADAAMARAAGIDVTADELIAQAAFRDAVAAVRGDYSRWLVSAIWRSESVSRPTILMSSATPPEVRAAVEKYGYAVSYSAPYTSDQRVALTQEIHLAVLKTPGVIGATTVIFAQDNKVYITAQVSKEMEPEVLGLLVEDHSKKMLGLPLGSSISLTGKSIGTAEYAGGEFYLGNGLPDLPLGSWSCTGSFVVKNSLNQYGILTARHCGAPAVNSYAGQTASLEAIADVSRGDILWARVTSGTSERRFRISGTEYRTVLGTGVAQTGNTLCKFGQTTGWGCSRFLTEEVCSELYCRLSAVEDWITEGGDSGGPWYIGNYAVGVHHGKKMLLGNTTRSLYTPVWLTMYLPNGVQVYR